MRAHMEAMFAEVAKLPHVSAVISPYAGPSAGKAISANHQIAFATVVFDEKANLLPVSARRTRGQSGSGGAPPGPRGGAGRAGDRGHPAGRLRPLHRRRADGGDRGAADHLRLAAGDGAADRDRAVWPRHGPQRDRAVHARRGHPQLLLGARRDDRPRRGDRLLAVHPHPLPRGLRRPRAHPRERQRVGGAGDGHRRARRAVRRHDRGDRAAGDDAAGRQLPLRRGDLGFDRRAAGDVRRTHAAARAAHLRGHPADEAEPAERAAARAQGSRERRAGGPHREGGVAAVERLRGAPPPPGGDPLGADHARDRRSRGRAAAGVERRQQRSHQHHHLPRLPPARGGLRRRLQWTPAGRREAPPPRRPQAPCTNCRGRSPRPAAWSRSPRRG